MNKSIIAYISPFKGEKTILLLCNNDAIKWLIEKFDRPIKFVIGNGDQFELSSQCYLTITPILEENISKIITENGIFIWTISPDVMRRYKALLQAMLETDKPCHQYLDCFDLESPQVIVSRDEYEIDSFRHE